MGLIALSFVLLRIFLKFFLLDGEKVIVKGYLKVKEILRRIYYGTVT